MLSAFHHTISIARYFIRKTNVTRPRIEGSKIIFKHTLVTLMFGIFCTVFPAGGIVSLGIRIFKGFKTDKTFMLLLFSFEILLLVYGISVLLKYFYQRLEVLPDGSFYYYDKYGAKTFLTEQSLSSLKLNKRKEMIFRFTPKPIKFIAKISPTEKIIITPLLQKHEAIIRINV